MCCRGAVSLMRTACENQRRQHHARHQKNTRIRASAHGVHPAGTRASRVYASTCVTPSKRAKAVFKAHIRASLVCLSSCSIQDANLRLTSIAPAAPLGLQNRSQESLTAHRRPETMPQDPALAAVGQNEPQMSSEIVCPLADQETQTPLGVDLLLLRARQ